jgi:hypothetical protein
MSSSCEIESPGASTCVDELESPRRISLCEALDRLLNTGVVVAGEVIISVADIDLVYLNLQLLLASFETACGPRRGPGARTSNTTSAP